MTDETLSLSGSIKLLEALPNRKRKITGDASHGGLVTYHPKDVYTKRIYITEQLQEAVVKTQKDIASGVKIPLMLDHEIVLPDCHLTKMWWEGNAVKYEAEISDTVARMITEGKITGCSLYSNPWIIGGGVKWANGFAPFGFKFEELSLTDDRMIPGDPNATVRFLEALEKKFEIDPKHLPKDPPLPEKEAQETEAEKPRELSALERFRRKRR